MTVFTENSTHPISSQKENSDLAVQIQMRKLVQFGFVPKFFPAKFGGGYILSGT